MKTRQIAAHIVEYHMIVNLLHTEWGEVMKMVRLLIQVPESIKAQLDALRQEGATASGFIRHLLEDYFKQALPVSRKGR